MFDTILNYLSQQSTWKGLIGLATAAGVLTSPDLAAAIVSAGMALIGVINVVRNEKK
jgi:hypothetical protein